MKTLCLSALSILLFISCSTTEQLKNVTHTYQNINFNPQASTQKIGNDLLLTVVPIDASEMDSLTYLATYRTGAYEQENIIEFDIDPDENDLSRRERRYVENAREAVDEILKNANNGSIPRLLGRRLVERIWNGDVVGLDGSEIESFSESNYDPSYNPYFIGNNYLSVFRLSFANNASNINRVSIDNFQVASSNEVLYPYESEYFQDRLETSESKLNNVNRFNLPDELILAPKQIVEKYISVPAINQSKGISTVQYIHNSEEVISFNFEISRQSQKISYELKKFQIDPEVFGNRTNSSSYRNFYAVRLENGRTFPLKGDSFYVPVENVNQTVEICYAGIPDVSKYDNELRCSPIDLSVYSNGRIRD